MSISEKKQALFRKEIVEAVFRLCQDKSPYYVTMRDVVSLSGITVRTIYNYFSSKEELMFELSTAIIEAKAEWLKDILSKHKDGLKKLIVYYQANIAYLKIHPTELSVAHYLQSAEFIDEKVSEEIRKKQADRRKVLFDIINEIYNTLKEDGYLIEGIDLSTVQELITYTMRQVMYLVVSLKIRAEDYYWEYIRMILRSILKQEFHSLIENHLSNKINFKIPNQIKLYEGIV